MLNQNAQILLLSKRNDASCVAVVIIDPTRKERVDDYQLLTYESQIGPKAGIPRYSKSCTSLIVNFGFDMTMTASESVSRYC